jgi:hypothetical protein
MQELYQPENSLTRESLQQNTDTFRPKNDTDLQNVEEFTKTGTLGMVISGF